MLAPPQRRPLGASAIVDACGIERRILGALIFGTRVDAVRIKSAGFDAAEIRQQAHLDAWQIIRWAWGIKLPAAAIPVMQSWRDGWPIYFDSPAVTRWDLMSWLRAIPSMPRPGPPAEIPAHVRRLMGTIEKRLR